ncbi:hypothetical protein ACROYT_G011664 [Oculina patagonica]
MTRMNGSGEIRKEAADRIMKVLGTKTKTRIGFWNVRTLYQTGKLAQVTAEMRRYCLRKAQAWQAQEYMATYSRDRIEGLKPKLEHHPTAGQRQTAVEDLCCCPTCQWAQWAVSEVYSDEARHELELISTTWLIDEFEQNLKSVANYRSAMNHLLNEAPELSQYLKQNLVVLTGDFPTWKYNKKIIAEKKLNQFDSEVKLELKSHLKRYLAEEDDEIDATDEDDGNDNDSDPDETDDENNDSKFDVQFFKEQVSKLQQKAVTRFQELPHRDYRLLNRYEKTTS